MPPDEYRHTAQASLQETGQSLTAGPPPRSVDCSILMPVLNEASHIVASVAAMRSQRFAGELEFLVADGGSTDSTLEILETLAREDRRLRVLHNPRRIASSGLNAGLREARGRYVARMDAHTAYPEDYVALGVERLGLGGTRWVSGPPIATGNGTTSRAVALALRSRLGRGGSRKWASERDAVGQEYELDAGVFAGVWERETLLAYGGWDEAWVCNQDSEMAGRFIAQGERLVCLPAMAAWYVPRGTLRGLWSQYLRYGEFREKTAIRHPHTMRRSHLFAPALVVGSVGAAVAPGQHIRTALRIALCGYGILLAAAAAGVAHAAHERKEVLLVPPVLMVMHFGHGVGMLRGVARHGPPVSALARALGLRRLADRLAPEPERVFAPTLVDGSGASKGG
jgi:GT2 family glycosyltransferase